MQKTGRFTQLVHRLNDLASIVATIPPPIESRIGAGNAIVAATGPHGIAIGTPHLISTCGTRPA